MRRKALLGVGLALLAGGPAAAQPVSPPRAPALPPGVSPVAPAGGAYPAAPGGVQPAQAVQPAAPAVLNIDPNPALGADHPWLIKPEHGPYFIMVKSYVRPPKGSPALRDDPGPTARELAEALAHDIRETYKVQAFLFEHLSEERKAEMRKLAADRQKAQAYQAELDKLRQRSQLQGMEFMAPDNKMRVMTHQHRDQIGVLVGGFQSEAAALKALTQLKTWPTPKNEILCDRSAIVQPGAGGKAEIVKAAINPYASAFVVPNPSVPRAAAPAGPRGLDPFVVKLNEGQPYSLLKATKGWTLAVKSFASPVEFSNKDAAPSVMQKAGFGKGAEVLAAGGEQAEELAKALRKLKGPVTADGRGGQSLNLEAFVLHTRTASLVTVGQFDGPDDPNLLATKRLLSSMTTRVSEDQAGTRPVTNAPALFENLTPIPVPKP